MIDFTRSSTRRGHISRRSFSDWLRRRRFVHNCRLLCIAFFNFRFWSSGSRRRRHHWSLIILWGRSWSSGRLLLVRIISLLCCLRLRNRRRWSCFWFVIRWWRRRLISSLSVWPFFLLLISSICLRFVSSCYGRCRRRRGLRSLSFRRRSSLGSSDHWSFLLLLFVRFLLVLCRWWRFLEVRSGHCLSLWLRRWWIIFGLRRRWRLRFHWRRLTSWRRNHLSLWLLLVLYRWLHFFRTWSRLGLGRRWRRRCYLTWYFFWSLRLGAHLIRRKTSLTLISLWLAGWYRSWTWHRRRYTRWWFLYSFRSTSSSIWNRLTYRLFLRLFRLHNGQIYSWKSNSFFVNLELRWAVNKKIYYFFTVILQISNKKFMCSHILLLLNCYKSSLSDYLVEKRGVYFSSHPLPDGYQTQSVLDYCLFPCTTSSGKQR